MVDPESNLERPWCLLGDGAAVADGTCRLSPPSAPQPPPSSSTYKNARRRTARALSQHFANLHSSHTKLENDTKWWASRKNGALASLGRFSRAHFAAYRTRSTWFMTSTKSTSRQTAIDTHRVRSARAGFLAAEKSWTDERPAWRFRCGNEGGLVSCHHLTTERGDDWVVHQCYAVHLLVLPAAERCAGRDQERKNGTGTAER